MLAEVATQVGWRGSSAVPANHLYMPLQKSLRVAARLLHKGPGVYPGPSFTLYVLPPNWNIIRVGDSGFEPLASSASRKRSPPELIARTKDLFFASPPRGGTRNRTGVQGFADPCLTTRPCRQHLGTGPPVGISARGQSGRRDSNPRPSPWQGDALPTELLPRCSRVARAVSI